MIKICDITEDGKYACDIGGASYLEVRDGKKEWVLYGPQDKAHLYPRYRSYEWPYPWKDTRQVKKVVPLGFYRGYMASVPVLAKPATYTIAFSVPKIYYPCGTIGGYTNMSEDSIGGILRVITHNPLDDWAYGTDEWLQKNRSPEEYKILKEAKERHDNK